MTFEFGYTDMGYHGLDLDGASPNIDLLVQQGIKLNYVYGGVACTPGRAMALTGRYAMRMGLQKGAIGTQQAKGIPVNNSLISNELKKVGCKYFLFFLFICFTSTIISYRFACSNCTTFSTCMCFICI